jgi:hypothetical protein
MSATTIPQEPVYRLVATRVPRVDPYEGLYDSEEAFEDLVELDNLTNLRIQDEISDLPLLPRDSMAKGSNAKILNAPFIYFSPDRPTRFSDGSFGVYYAAFSEETCVREIAHHLSEFYRATDEPDLEPDYEFWKSKVVLPLLDIRSISGHSLYLNAQSYRESQVFGFSIRSKHPGLIYPSVRDEAGLCVALFTPLASSNPRKGKTIKFNWNSKTKRITWYHVISKSKEI